MHAVTPSGVRVKKSAYHNYVHDCPLLDVDTPGMPVG